MRQQLPELRSEAKPQVLILLNPSGCHSWRGPGLASGGLWEPPGALFPPLSVAPGPSDNLAHPLVYLLQRTKGCGRHRTLQTCRTQGALCGGSGDCPLWGSESEPQEAGHLESPALGLPWREGPVSVPVPQASGAQMRKLRLLRVTR